MSLRWLSYVAPNSPKGGSKNANRPFFSLKSHFSWRKSATKFLYVKTVSGKVVAFVGHSLANYPCKNDWWGTSLSTWNFESNWPRWSEIANFRSIFAGSALTITPSKKSSISTNRKSTTCFPMIPRWTSYVVPKPPSNGGSKTQCPKFEQ